MIKSLVAAVALTIGVAGYAVAQEPARHHHQYHRHHSQPRPSPHLQPGPSAYLQPGASAYVLPAPSAESPDIFWSPAGGNPIHYGQTTGFYGGR